jgi:hypothetical protein
MRYEFRSIAPDRLARLMALAWGALFALISIRVFLLAPALPPGSGQPPKIVFVVAMVLYPLIGAAWAWICGHIMDRIYNYCAQRLGGLTFEASKLDE